MICQIMMKFWKSFQEDELEMNSKEMNYLSLNIKGKIEVEAKLMESNNSAELINQSSRNIIEEGEIIEI